MKAFAIAIVAAVLLLGLYAGSYFLMVVRACEARSPLDDGCVVPEFGVGGDFAKRLFAPAHRVDRAIRSTYWSLEGARNDLRAGQSIDIADTNMRVVGPDGDIRLK